MVGVQIAGVRKVFGQALAVDHIDLEIPDGSFTTFLGPSGCGKTTTLRMVAGLERPTSGRIMIGDEVVCGDGAFVPPERRQIGMVFQSYAIWPHLTVFDNVSYPLVVRRLPRDDVRARTMAALKTVQLEALAERYPAQLSGGQQQRVAVARSIVFEPRILLFDEPLSNLDAKLREQMRLEIRDLQERLGVTTLYVTHDQHEALTISDQVAVMNLGRIVQIGAPREVYERPVSRFVADFVGWTNFLPCTVVDDGTVAVLDRRLACTLPEGMPPGAAGHLSVRPEDLGTGTAAADGDAAFEGEVRATYYVGKTLVCEISVGGHRLRSQNVSPQGVAVGRTVAVNFDPEAALVLKD